VATAGTSPALVLTCCGHDNTVRVWSTASTECVQTIHLAFSATAFSVACSPSGACWFAVGTTEGRVAVYHLPSQRASLTLVPDGAGGSGLTTPTHVLAPGSLCSVSHVDLCPGEGVCSLVAWAHRDGKYTRIQQPPLASIIASIRLHFSLH